MKNNQYIEKYGEKALQLYNKKSLKQTVISDIQIPSDSQAQLQQKQSFKRIQKSVKTSSHKSLNRHSKSKSKISTAQNQNQYTFQKPLNLQHLQDKDKDKQRKKLIISGLSTPKNNRSARMVSGQQQKIPSSSTKKKQYDVKISQKLNQALIKNKSTKSVVKQLLECLDMISQHECKINKWIGQFKDIVYNIADQAICYRRKYKEELAKNKKLQKDYQDLQSNLKINVENKKRKPVQLIVIQQNQKLREKVNKLQQKIQNFQKKQMVLINTLQKMKTSKIGNHQTNSSIKRQQNSASNKIKRQFYGNLQQYQDQDGSQNQQQQQNL